MTFDLGAQDGATAGGPGKIFPLKTLLLLHRNETQAIIIIIMAHHFVLRVDIPVNTATRNIRYQTKRRPLLLTLIHG